MENIPVVDEFIDKINPPPKWPRILLLTAGIVLFAVVSIAGTVYFYQRYYANRVYPGVYLGKYYLGGMEKGELRDFVENLNSRLMKEELNYYLIEDGKQQDFKVETILARGEDSAPLLTLYTDEFVEKVFHYGREKESWQKYFLPFSLILKNKYTNFDLRLDEQNFKDNLRQVLEKSEDKAHDANVKITSLIPLRYEIIPEKVGQVFDYEKIITDTKNNLQVLELSSIQIQRHQFYPQVLQNDLSNVTEQLERLVLCGDLLFKYAAPVGQKDTFIVRIGEIMDWITAKRSDSGEVYFFLNEEKFSIYLKSLKEIIDVPVQNPKFSLVNGKVREFKEQKPGLSLNLEETKEMARKYFEQDACFGRENNNLNLVMDKVESDIKLKEVNDMGITGLFGTGTSTFYDSHTNRIKNIAHAVELLNGVLIPPGEVFSAIKYAGPFTLENGYLPEEIIKGDRIIKEVGGGMCQIGTTLFRMAMNAGMDITQRHNHSLVVSYYADPVNKNPGTDAALYDPFLDLKFKNDTDGYLLLQTNIDYKKQMLTFSLWGKVDGRYGHYTPPLVSRWIPAGEPQEVLSPELKPGEVKCQNAFRGAISSFTYTRFTSSSEKIERVFTSNYRPLPKLCLVGPALPTSTPSSSMEIKPSEAVVETQPEELNLD